MLVIYYSYCCSVFGLVVVYALPSGSFAHCPLQFPFLHFVSELPF